MLRTKEFKLLLFPLAAVLLIAAYPQLSLWLTQGSSWNGSYAVSNYDEPAYSAYVGALIDGKPRKYDPFFAAEVEYESLYSIQFVPAYSIAIPARLFGVSASSAFIILNLVIAAASVMAIFWLFFQITGNGIVSSTGVMIVLCLGTAAALQGEIRHFIDGRLLVDHLPFLRRYQPGFAFPLYFVFCGLVWLSFRKNERRSRTLLYAVLGGIAFAVIIFSYFYLWTAAAAWLALVTLLALVLLKEDRKQVLFSFAITGSLAVLAFVPYFLMLSQRSETIDSIQLLTFSRMPNPASPTLILGVAVAAGVAVLIWKKRILPSSPSTIFALAFALTPLILFNQQIVTGRSLQPVHYEIFIANYMVLFAAVLLIWMFFAGRLETEERQHSYKKIFVYLGLAATVIGFVEAAGSTQRAAVTAEIRDGSIPAIEYIKADAKDLFPVVHATNFITADIIPTFATVRVLWNPHSSSAGSIDVAENKRLFYLYLYYSGFSDKDLAEALAGNSFETTAAIFGSERALPLLGENAAAVRSQEIRSEAAKYGEFVRSFNERSAASPVISHIIVPAEAEPSYENLDRWYSRDNGQAFGLFKVYKLEPRFAR